MTARRRSRDNGTEETVSEDDPDFGDDTDFEDADGPVGEIEEADDGTEVDPEELEEAFDEELEHAAVKYSEPKGPNAFVRLYRGGTSFDFIGNRRWWFAISALIILAGLVSLGTRGLNEGIDFKGGSSWTVSSQSLTVAQATDVAKASGVTQPVVVSLTNQVTHVKQIQVQADLNNLSGTKHQATVFNLQTALARAAHVPTSAVSINDVGPTWGGQVTDKAIEALIIFFIAVAIYISIRFEFKMAVAAIIAVIHDLLVTVGVYSLFGFQVTPDTVIAVLTVLGYSLYDTVVVFDRIRDNATGLGASGRISYSDMVNLSMNQTLARSINTSAVAIVPVLSVLVVGSIFLGATSLQDFGLALVIGLTSGAYSSIFIASPLLALMKEREPRYRTIRQRLETRGDRVGILTPAAAAAMAGAGAGGGRAASRNRPQTAGVIRPGGGAKVSRSTGAAPRAGTKAGGTASAGGVRSGSGQASSSGGGARSGPGSSRPGGNRPPPRPRKGKGKGGKRKRR
ncbi:MAG TPA: protein translocase subunit SecF [Acidimicrobiales bacterium]|jgi:preprotein translocase subunit SecF|nr:protein translocase subunit SecF [Acidimicrobiales bacterium]